MELFDEWKFLAGLGIFLFGMFEMEESIKALAGRSFKVLIRRWTGTRLKGLVSGLLTTAILQSSSAVSLMVLAFVGAGLMTLGNAMAVIIGAKVGTTCTAWIVALLGFKFSIDAFALPLIGLGGLGLILLRASPRFVNLSKLCAAFGFLFLGLDFMKTSVEGLAASLDLAALPDLGLWVYLLVGILMTAVMQSSSATIAIILTTLHSGIIDFGQASSMVIGANVGTTVTVLLGAIGGIPVKKQAAASSLVYSGGTGTVVFLILPAMVWISRDVAGFADQAVLGIALFHTLFNVVGATIYIPLIPRLVPLLERAFPERRVVLTRFILNTSPEVPDAAIAAMRSEVRHQMALSMDYIGRLYGLSGRPPGLGDNGSEQREAPTYSDLDGLHAEIFSFYARLQAHSLDEMEARELDFVIRASRSTMNATRNFHQLRPEIEEICADENPFLSESCRHFRDRLDLLCGLVAEVTGADPTEDSSKVLADFFRSVEDADRKFIHSCSEAVTAGQVREQEVTMLLMTNRFFTQSNRMLVLSLQSLTASSGN